MQEDQPSDCMDFFCLIDAKKNGPHQLCRIAIGMNEGLAGVYFKE